MYATSTFRVLVLFSAALFARGEGQGSAADRLKVVSDILAQGPIKLVRPDGAEGPGSAVKVAATFSLVSLAQVDTISGRFDVVGWMTYTWTDPRLQFSAEAGTSIRMGPSQIWTPDIEVYNAAGSGVEMLNQKLEAIVMNDGEVLYVPQMFIPTVCDMTSVASSIDCNITIGSWSFSHLEIDLDLDPAGLDLAYYVPHPGWIVRNASAARHVKQYECCEETFVTLVFSVSLQRRSP